MELDVPTTTKAASSVLAKCTDIILAAYSFWRAYCPKGFRGLLNDIRELAVAVDATVSFWGLHPLLPMTGNLLNITEALGGVLQDCLTTLGRIEDMLLERETRAAELGSASLDLKLLHWKLRSYKRAIRVVSVMLQGNAELLHIATGQLRRQARLFQGDPDWMEERGKTGDLLELEVKDIDQNITHIRALLQALTVDSTERPGAEIPAPRQATEESEWTVSAPDDSLAQETTGAVPTSASNPVTSALQDQENSPRHATPVCSDYDTTSANTTLEHDGLSPRNGDTLDCLSSSEESKDVQYIMSWIRNGDYALAESNLREVTHRISLGIPSRLALAEAFYTGGKLSIVTELLNIPLCDLQQDPLAEASAHHILAKTYFAGGHSTQAKKHCDASLDLRRRNLRPDNPCYLETAELFVQVLRADGEQWTADTVRMDVFSSLQDRFLYRIDALEAAFKGPRDEVRMLMSGVLTELDAEGFSPDDLLESLGPSDTWGYPTEVLGFSTDISLLTILADVDDFEKVILLISRGNVTVGLPDGRIRPAVDTLLRIATLRGQRERVEILLDLGADIEATDDTVFAWRDLTDDYPGMTPLHIAAVEGHAAVVECLLRRGANIEAMNSLHQTPLAAVRTARIGTSKRAAVAQLLRRRGAV
ncbi:hypothetical protein BJX61DRAFT_200915 [Aspergillus egyptiacus]|nr:hypothetical protein BJX61DRAFT_200915 [Aspergillus egyptiacus]